MSRILFYGDPHGQWKPLLEACSQERPDAVVILGDCDLKQPLSVEVKPLLEVGIPVHWIPGNHDSDRQIWFDHLFHGGLDTSLHGVVTEVAGVRVAGLGGTFQEAVWHPQLDGHGIFHTPEDYVNHLAQRGLLDGRERLAHTAIFPDTYNRLADLEADVLVTHEAPGCHRHGFEELDLLAEAMGVSRIVHGHHHESYEATLDNGIAVTGLGRAQPLVLEMRPSLHMKVL